MGSLRLLEHGANRNLPISRGTVQFRSLTSRMLVVEYEIGIMPCATFKLTQTTITIIL